MIKELTQLEQMEKDFGRRLRYFRERANLSSAEEVAKELQMGLDALYKNENGVALPFRRTLQTLCDFYGLNNDDTKSLFKDRQAIIDLRKKLKAVR